MAPPQQQLPWEIEEAILSRLPPQSLLRFKSVCKRWNNLFNKDKTFINNHLSRSRPHFIILANSKIYTVEIIIGPNNDIDPTIKLLELHAFGIPIKYENFFRFTACDELLFCNCRFLHGENWTGFLNPWLRQVKWNKNNLRGLYVLGLGYDNSSKPEKMYKILAYACKEHKSFAIYECVSHAWKLIDTHDHDDDDDKDSLVRRIANKTNVSLNGNMYWITQSRESCSDYVIQSFDFSKEDFKIFCRLSGQEMCYGHHDKLVLAVYKGDRFSLLRQCYRSGKMVVWVMKKKTAEEEEEKEVVWIKLMTLPTDNLLGIVSYFVHEKTMFMCCGGDDERGITCIYIVREDMWKRFQLGDGIVKCCHCVYTPNLISLPQI